MKAIDIINFINEDKFSKYTASQIYDELGHEDFFDYLENICTKIIKEFDTEIKHAIPSIEITNSQAKPRIVYKSKYESFIITYDYGSLSLTYLIISSSVAGSYVDKRQPNIIPQLKSELIKIYNADTARRIRRELKKYEDMGLK